MGHFWPVGEEGELGLLGGQFGVLGAGRQAKSQTSVPSAVTGKAKPLNLRVCTNRQNCAFD